MDYFHYSITLGSSIATAYITTKITNWINSEREQKKIIIGTLEFYKAVIAADKTILLRSLSKADGNCNVLLPFRKLNLSSSILDYVSVFAVNPDMAGKVMSVLYEREYIADICAKESVSVVTVTNLLEKTEQAIQDIDTQLSSFRKKSLLAKLLQKTRSRLL